MTALFPFALVALVGLPADEGPVLPAPAPEPTYVRADKTSAAVFAWEWGGLNTDGLPAEADRAEYRFWEIGDDGELTGNRHFYYALGKVTPNVTTRHKLVDVLGEVSPGRYRAYVRLRSTEGTWGPFAPYLRIQVIEGPPPPSGPAAPVGLRIEGGAS